MDNVETQAAPAHSGEITDLASALAYATASSNYCNTITGTFETAQTQAESTAADLQPQFAVLEAAQATLTGQGFNAAVTGHFAAVSQQFTALVNNMKQVHTLLADTHETTRAAQDELGVAADVFRTQMGISEQVQSHRSVAKNTAFYGESGAQPSTGGSEPTAPTPGNPGMGNTTEPTVTYTTPEVPRGDLDDYRPNKGLSSVQDSINWICENYPDTEVNAITTPTGVKFEVTGPHHHLANLADFYGEALPKPSALPQGELSAVRALAPGTRAAVDLVQDADGRVAIRKTFHPDSDDMNRADREVAAAAVAHAVGITDLEVRHVDPDTVLMTYFDGKTGTDLAYATMSPEDVALLDDDAATTEQIEDPEWLARWSKADDEYRENLKPWMRAPGAKEIALFDYLALNIDRNSSNWIVDDDGVVHPIDHDATFIGAIQQVQYGLISFDSPFVRAWLAKDSEGSGHKRPDALASPFSRSHLDQVMKRLEDTKPMLDKIPPVRGVSTYDLVRQRLTWLIEACDATT